MRYERDDRERLLDDAVLLYLWAGAQNKQTGSVGDRLKLTKLAFMVANDLYWNNIKGLNLPFYRYTYGPYSKELNTTWDDLASSGHMVEDECFRITDDGFRLAKSFSDEVLETPANGVVKQTLDEVIDRFGAMPTDDLLNHVYGMRCRTLGNSGKHLVSSIKLNTDMTAIVEEEDAKAVLQVSPGWEMTLELALHPDALSNLQDGIESIQQGRVHGWEVFNSCV